MIGRNRIKPFIHQRLVTVKSTHLQIGSTHRAGGQRQHRRGPRAGTPGDLRNDVDGQAEIIRRLPVSQHIRRRTGTSTSAAHRAADWASSRLLLPGRHEHPVHHLAARSEQGHAPRVILRSCRGLDGTYNRAALEHSRTKRDRRGISFEGQTLADRLERGALPLDEAIQIATEVADGPMVFQQNQ